MKYLLTIIAVITVYSARAQGINFEQRLTWSQIQTKAKSENKYIFVDAYATWCGPCKIMSAEVFPQREVRDFVNDNFIAVKIQMDQTKDDNEHIKSWYSTVKAINDHYKITVYPTILFFSPEGKLIHRTIGFRDSKTLLNDAKDALNPEKQYYTLLNRYESGKRDAQFVRELAIQADQVGQTEMAKKISQRFTDKLSSYEVLKKENLLLAYRFTTSSKDKLFPILIKDSVKINSILGKNKAELKLRAIIGKEEIAPFLKNQEILPDWNLIEQTIKAKYGAIGLEVYYGERMAHAASKKDWVECGKYYALYYATAYSRSQYHINNISWTIFENVTDSKVLDVAINTMKYNIEHFDRNNIPAYDTYANLLYKTGKMQEAILLEEKALAMEEENASKDNRKPDPVYAETLEKMKAGIATWKE